jgi:hypothetical protein
VFIGCEAGAITHLGLGTRGTAVTIAVKRDLTVEEQQAALSARATELEELVQDV